MDRDEDLESFSPTKSHPSPVPGRKLKRLKKAKTLKEYSPKLQTQDSEEPKLDSLNLEKSISQELKESKSGSGSGSEGSEDENESYSEPGVVRVRFEKDGTGGAKRSLLFDSEEIDGGNEDRTLDSEEPKLDTSGLEKSNSPELKKPDSGSRSGSEDGLDSVVGGSGLDEDGSGAKRGLLFDSVDEELDGRNEDRIDDMEMEKENNDVRVEEPEKKRRSSDGLEEKKVRKKRVKRGSDDDDKPKSAGVSKRKAEKERKEELKQLRVVSQKLLRETRDASFKSVPLVQKPISSVLEKIRQRKLEISKKAIKLSKPSFMDYDDDEEEEDEEDFCISREVKVNNDLGSAPANKAKKMVSEHAISSPANPESGVDALLADDASNSSANHSSDEVVHTQMAVDEEPKQAFRAPLDDTQDLFPESQENGSKDEFPDDTPSSPLEEVLAPSLLAMNLKLGSAPPDDISSSSSDDDDEEDNDKENTDPHLHKLVDSSSPRNGNHAKAFVDDEAEEEDDSDNDLMRFQDNEEDEDNEDAEELQDLIATAYEEKPVDIERRNELHQKWLEQQDAAGTENLLQRLKSGSKPIETALLEEEEDEETEEDDDEFDDEDTENAVSANIVRMNLKKVKEMIPQMFTDKDDPYISSDDEETEQTLVKQCFFEKSEEKTTFLSPAEDKDSKDVFSLIKKMNIVPDTRRKAKRPAVSDMRHVGGNGMVPSKSSFLGRGSNHSLQLPQRQASSTFRSFIFERDDSNSRSSILGSEVSSDTIQSESRPTKVASTKLYSSQIKSSTQNTNAAAAETNSGTSLFEFLRRSSSLQSSNSTRDRVVSHTGSVLATFKLEKQIKKEPIRSVRTL